MNTEDVVRNALHEHAGENPPPVDVAGLVRRGRRRRAVTRAGSVLAVAAVVAGGVVGATAFSGGDASRGGSEVVGTPNQGDGPAPLPGPSEVFVYADGRISIDGVVSDARKRANLHITREGVAYSDDRRVPHLLTAAGEDVALAPGQPRRAGAEYADWVAADPTRPLVAWTEVASDGSDVVLYDTAAGQEVARRSLPCYTSRFVDGCPHSYVMSDGLVFVSVERGISGWDPLGLTRSPDEYFPVDATELLQAHGRTVMRPSWMKDDTFAGLPPGWTATEPVDENALLSFDGDWLLTGFTVTALDDPDRKVELDPPGEPVEAQFDLDGSVLVVVAVDGGFQVVDCAFDGDCAGVSPVDDEPMRLVLTDT
jgi:hypothetical protein